MQVDFYQLSGAPAEPVIASLAEKVLEGDGRLLIVAEDEVQLARLDRMLWAHEGASFLPHGVGAIFSMTTHASSLDRHPCRKWLSLARRVISSRCRCASATVSASVAFARSRRSVTR